MNSDDSFVFLGPLVTADETFDFELTASEDSIVTVSLDMGFFGANAVDFTLASSTSDAIGPSTFQDVTPTQILTFLLGAGATETLTLDLFGFTTGGVAPVLEISAAIVPVPLPASVWLFIGALAGLGLIGRQRAQA